LPTLKDTATLAELQRYVTELEQERGFSDQSARDKCLLLGEELGELFRAVRRAEGLKVDPASRPAEVAEELADCLIYLCAIANRYGVDLEEAFRAKEEKNVGRAWTVEGPAVG
jgi:NTP pyrophosphatase (non-canonical NTP hydrolase)